MIWRTLAFALPFIVTVSASAGLLPAIGGAPSSTPTPAPAFACGTEVPPVCADHAFGQTGVQWTDNQVAGVTDYTKRYRVMRSSLPLNSGNCTSGTVIGKYDLPNSAQLIGGNPDSGTGQQFTQANRQANNSSNPMGKIPDASTGGVPKQLVYPGGLQVYHAQATENAYYCVMATNTSDGSPSYIGAVGPIGESAGAQKPVAFAHRTTGIGNITYSSGVPTGTSGLPIVLELGASNAGAGGAAGRNTLGDYWEWFGDTSEGWQDGSQRIFDVFKDRVGSTLYPSLPNTLVVGTREAIWNSTGTPGTWIGMETDHHGIGMTPLNGTANRIYPTTMTSYKRFLSWMCDPSFYHTDCTQIHITGPSLGAIGGALISSHPSNGIKIASTWMAHPIFRLDLFRSSFWAGELWGGTTGSPWPFSATLANGPFTMGTSASAALMSDNVTPVSTYFDLPAVWAASPGTDLPFFGGMDTKNDDNLLDSGPKSWITIVEGINALQAAHRGHAFAFYMGGHDTGSVAMGSINCDWDVSLSAPIAGICYNKSLFGTTIPYAAFDASSIDDNIGTGSVDSSGMQDGDFVGVINAGFTWNFIADTAGSLHFAVGNGWMGRPATDVVISHLSASMADNCTSGTVTVDDPTWNGHVGETSANYWVIGTGATKEALFGTFSGSTVTFSARCWLGSTHHLHSIGEQIIWFQQKATGPNIGAQTAMTANVTPRRLQGFVKAAGASVSCTVTPFGGGASTISGTVIGTEGVFTLPAVPINVGGVTDIQC